MKKTIGVFAHVDAGKTTFSERILFKTGAINTFGRVDQQSSFLDTNAVEQSRGITVWSDQAVFEWKGDTYYLIDTPGHVDFSAEAERTIGALDYGILLISGSSGVQAHTTALFRLLQAKGIPVFFFINKTDLDSFRLQPILDEIRSRLTEDAVYLKGVGDISQVTEHLAEFAAERDNAFLEAYLADRVTRDYLLATLVRLVKERKCFPILSGSALKDIAIDSFLDVFGVLTPTNYDVAEKDIFQARVYKVRHDENGNRVTFLKIQRGVLQVRDEFVVASSEDSVAEKVNEIRLYRGNRYETRKVATAGDAIAVTGLTTPMCGSVLEDGVILKSDRNEYTFVPSLQAQVVVQDDLLIQCLEKLRVLEDEDPMLSVTFRPESRDILVSVMGSIQLEVLEQVMASRFGLSVAFGKPQVQYRETIAAPVVGYGHFEPLRHYAEVQLRLEPNPRGKGITFASECHVDRLPLSFQRLIETHVFEKEHRGVLTGFPITDVHIVLQDGLAHEKHTSGGDFREATYRAIRQGLEKAESILLEPFYQFEICVESEYLGRVLADIQRLHGTFEPPRQNGSSACITGRGPAATFMDYSVALASFTKGTGSVAFLPDGYDLCHNPAEVVRRIGYDKLRDMENLSSSVFCSNGTSFVVPWDEAEKYMHTLKK